MLAPITQARKKLLTNRWWVYQKERFPIFKYGCLITIFSGSALGYNQLLQGETTISFQTWIVAFIITFGLFLQMRIADEFKDYQDDRRYRPERAVPRGIVTLPELGILGGVIGCLQVFLVVHFIPQSTLYFGLVLGYFFLMCAEFGRRQWLKHHLSIYMLSHMIILPLIGLFNSMTVGQFQAGLLLFCLVCFFNGVVIEVGRKIYAPKAERNGVETYTAMWGAKVATLVWLSAIFLSVITTFWAAILISFNLYIGALMIILLMLAIIVRIQFLQRLDSKSAKRIETMSSVWILISYFSLGLLPFCMIS